MQIVLSYYIIALGLRRTQNSLLLHVQKSTSSIFYFIYVIIFEPKNFRCKFQNLGMRKT